MSRGPRRELTAAVLHKAQQAPAIALSRIDPAVITAVEPGEASDGSALVTISWRDAEVSASYLATYAPVVGHVVAVIVQGPQLLILGRIVGTPKF